MPDPLDTDDLTRADLERELHYMQTQVEAHGFPGTRAVLAELERLRAENARLIAALREIASPSRSTYEKVGARDGTCSECGARIVYTSSHGNVCNCPSAIPPSAR